MRFLVISIIWLLIDLYCFQAIKTSLQNNNNSFKNTVYIIYWVTDIILISIILFLYFSGKIDNSGSKMFSSLFGLMIISLAPKLIITPFLLIEDVIRIGSYSIHKILSISSSNKVDLTERRRIVSQLSLGLASIPFVGLIYGVIKGKYNYKTHR